MERRKMDNDKGTMYDTNERRETTYLSDTHVLIGSTRFGIRGTPFRSPEDPILGSRGPIFRPRREAPGTPGTPRGAPGGGGGVHKGHTSLRAANTIIGERIDIPPAILRYYDPVICHLSSVICHLGRIRRKLSSGLFNVSRLGSLNLQAASTLRDSSLAFRQRRCENLPQFCRHLVASSLAELS